VNKTRILRLDESGRRSYISQELSREDINSLRRFAAEYGVQGTAWMSKAELIQAVTSGLLEWAEREVLA
jgi:hypothetical protein